MVDPATISHDLQPHLPGTGDYFNAQYRTTPKERAQNRNQQGFSFFCQTASSSAKLQALFCHAVFSFLALVVPNRGQRLYLTKHFCFSCTVVSSLARKTGNGTQEKKKKQKGDWSLWKAICEKPANVICLCVRNGLGRLEEEALEDLYILPHGKVQVR